MNLRALVTLRIWVGLGAGCAGALGPEPPAVPVAPTGHDDRGADPARKPDGVVLEPPPAVPSALESAEVQGVIALREPVGGDAVRDVVMGVVDAWRHESLDELLALLTTDAGPIESRSRGRSALVENWRQRLHAHEYRRLSTAELVRPERIERYSWEDLSAPDSPARPPDMRPDELYVRVPIETTWLAGERIFGDEMLLLLRREEGRYRVAAYGEVDEP